MLKAFNEAKEWYKASPLGNERGSFSKEKREDTGKGTSDIIEKANTGDDISKIIDKASNFSSAGLDKRLAAFFG